MPARSDRSAHSGGVPNRVRIVGGAWKRTPIPVADVPGLRPTAERVRQTLFDWLAHLKPDTAALRGLDLFAGSGALGFELASRGARRVVLVDHRRAALANLHALKTKLAAESIEIVAGDALAVAARLPAAGFDIVFVDPPFDSGLLWPAVEACGRLLAGGGLIYAETGTPMAARTAAEHGMLLVRNGRAGRVRFCLLAPMAA